MGAATRVPGHIIQAVRIFGATKQEPASRTNSITGPETEDAPRAEMASSSGRRRSAQFWRYVLFAVILASFGLGAWSQRDALLQGSADLWVVSDPITCADAVVVLGGGYDVRPIVAADLYAKGLVQKVLVSQDGHTKTGASTGDTERNVQILQKLGVPDTSIELFGNGSKDTWDEAVALRNWTNQHRISALIVPVEVFFARRARWVFRAALSGTDIHVEVPSYDPPHAYSQVGWWKTGGWTVFPTEVAKYLYYRVRY